MVEVLRFGVVYPAQSCDLHCRRTVGANANLVAVGITEIGTVEIRMVLGSRPRGAVANTAAP